MTGPIVGLLVLLTLSFLFSMVEYGYVTMTPMALEKAAESSVLADRLSTRMAAGHSMLIAVVVLGNNMANLGASFIFARVVLTVFTRVNPDLLAVVSTLALTVVVVIFAETIPKSIGRAFPEQVMHATAIPLYPFYLLLYPGARALATISGVFTGPLLRHAKHTGHLNDSDDFRYLLKMGQEDGVIDKEEERLIHNIFDYTSTLAYEIMTPFVDVTTVEKNVPISDVIKAIDETGHSRLPIMDDDNVVGLVYAKDALRAMAGGAGPNVKASGILRQPFFAPDTKKISSLLQEMQRQRIQIAVLFDEYGAVSGLITVEDILEEVFGEIQEEYDTVAGLMLSEIGRLPRVGDKVERGGIVFTVVNVVGKRISRVRAERLPPAPSRPTEDEE